MMNQNDQDRAKAKAFLAMLDESLPDSTKEMLEEKGTPDRRFDVPRSDSRKPRLESSAHTKRWHPTGKKRKNRRKMAKASRHKNRKRRK
jgi:hypothetical protein